MKFLHTSDWHLGRMLYGRSLLPDQQHFIREQFLPLAEREKPDAVLLAGDVYDRSVAPAGAIALFDEVLTRLAELNIPLLVGGAINWYVTSRSKDTALNTRRGERGTLLASGFIAGGALMGVVSAGMRFGGINWLNEAWLANTWSQVAALVAYALLIIYFVKSVLRIK